MLRQCAARSSRLDIGLINWLLLRLEPEYPQLYLSKSMDDTDSVIDACYLQARSCIWRCDPFTGIYSRHGTFAWALKMSQDVTLTKGWAKDRGEPNSEQEWLPDAAYIGQIYAPLGGNWHPPSAECAVTGQVPLGKKKVLAFNRSLEEEDE